MLLVHSEENTYKVRGKVKINNRIDDIGETKCKYTLRAVICHVGEGFETGPSTHDIPL